jgi:uncharacterized protein DUF929
MVDWDAVEKLRSKGWDWDRIAADPKVGFHAEEAAGEPGRALRALYYQRRSKSQRRPSRSEGGGKGSDVDLKPPWSLARIGWILLPLAAIWFVAAYFYPSPVGTYFPALPYLGLILAACGFILAFGLLRTDERWSKVMRNSAITGVVFGLIIVGGFTLAAEINGCPTLPPISGSEPQGWEKASAAAWTSNGMPVFFFAGSEACPYCSASSWAMYYALQAFGTVTNVQLFHSNPDDTPSNIPEVVLANAQVSSPYVSFDVLEGQDDSAITIPAASSCTQQAYISAYDTGGSIPFNSINGQYVHVGTLVDPTQLQGYSPQQIDGQMQNQSEPAWGAVSPAMYMIEAFIVKSDGGLPHSIADDPNVAPLLAQIT